MKLEHSHPAAPTTKTKIAVANQKEGGCIP